MPPLFRQRITIHRLSPPLARRPPGAISGSIRHCHSAIRLCAAGSKGMLPAIFASQDFAPPASASAAPAGDHASSISPAYTRRCFRPRRATGAGEAIPGRRMAAQYHGHVPECTPSVSTRTVSSPIRVAAQLRVRSATIAHNYRSRNRGTTRSGVPMRPPDVRHRRAKGRARRLTSVENRRITARA